MSLNRLEPESQLYAGTLGEALALLDYSLTTARRPPTIWAVQGPGENWDDVTEEFQSRPVQAALICANSTSFGGPECAIAVNPEFRGRGLAKRLLRWTLTNQYDEFTCRVRPDQREGFAFAAKYGRFLQVNTGLFYFEVTRETSRLPHIGCSCSDCYNELSFAA